MTTLHECLAVAIDTRWRHAKDQTGLAREAEAAIRDIGTATVRAITPEKLRNVRRAWRKRGLSPATCNRRLAALSSCLRAAIEEGILDKAPRFPQRLPEPPGRERCPTREELSLLLTALRSTGRSLEAELARVLAATGLRVSEALAVCPCDIERDGGGTWWLRVRTSKTGKPRMIPLPPRLSGWCMRAVCHGDTPVFARVRQSTFSLAWRNARKAAGLGDWLVPHTLRHMRASALASAGAPVPTVAAILGHGDWRTTQRYVHIQRDQVAAAVLAAECRQ